MTVDKGVPFDRALEMLKLKLGQVKVAFARDQVAKGKVGDRRGAGGANGVAPDLGRGWQHRGIS